MNHESATEGLLVNFECVMENLLAVTGLLT